MSTAIDPNRVYTADDLYAMGEDARYELVRGELRVREPSGPTHGDVTMRVSFALASFVYARGLGRVYAAETGFVIRRSPDTVRAPDASFIGADRLPAGGFGPGFAPIAPDLAVEVMSPSDTIPQVWQKVDDYLGAGVRAVWVVDPARGTVAVHQPGVAARLLAGDDVLDGGAVLPGFQFPVASLFVP